MSGCARRETGEITMLSKTTIALLAALSLGAASTALAEEYDGTGKPIDMHIVAAQRNAMTDVYAATRAPANVLRVRPFVSPMGARAGDPDPFIRFQVWRDSQWKTGG
jgi:hypothetical protein